MEIAIFILPFIVAIFLLLFFRKETVWWEYAVVIVPSLLVSLMFEFIFKSYNVSDTEYLGSYVTKLRHTDEWDEWIHKTCHRTHHVGKHTYTTSYDCSHREYHPEKWTYFTSDGREEYTDEETWMKMKTIFNVPETFVEMNRNYYHIDGDAQDYCFSGDWMRSITDGTSHSYDNPVLGSRSLFKFKDISEDEADSLGLFNYPKLENCMDQNPILGVYKPSTLEKRKIQWVNGRYGKEHQFRMFILTWPSKKYGPSVSDLQKSYWQGGNKNELIVCLGIDSKGKVTWVRTFSWEDRPVLATSARVYFENNPNMNLVSFGGYIEGLIRTGQWTRKEFKDFSYLTVELTDGQAVWVLIFTLIYNVAISTWVILNDYKNEDDEKSKKDFKKSY